MGPMNIGSLILNFGVNTCFGLSGTKWGKNKAGGLMAGAIGFGMIDLFLQLFAGGDQGKVPPGITQADLDKSLDELGQRIEAGIFDMFQSEHLLDVQAVIRQHNALWDQMLAQMTTWTNKPAIDKAVWDSWEKSFDFFDNESQPGLSATLKARDFVTTQVKLAPNNLTRKYETLPLHMLASGAYLNACQFVIMREWQKIVSGMNAPGSAFQLAYAQWCSDLDTWQTAQDDWDSRRKAWDVAEQARVDAINNRRAQQAQSGGGGGFGGGGGMKNWRNPPGGATIVPFNDDSLDDVTFESPKPFSEAEPPMPPAPIGPPAEPTELLDTAYAGYLRQYVGEAIDYATPLLRDLLAAYAADQVMRTTRLGGISAVKLLPNMAAASPIMIRNEVLDYTSPVAMPADLTDDALTIEMGITRAGIARQTSPIAGIVPKADLDSYMQAVSTWVESHNNYCRPGDTLRTDPFPAT